MFRIPNDSYEYLIKGNPFREGGLDWTGLN